MNYLVSKEMKAKSSEMLDAAKSQATALKKAAGTELSAFKNETGYDEEMKRKVSQSQSRGVKPWPPLPPLTPRLPTPAKGRVEETAEAEKSSQTGVQRGGERGAGER